MLHGARNYMVRVSGGVDRVPNVKESTNRKPGQDSTGLRVERIRRTVS